MLAEKLPNMVFINKKGRVVYTNEKSIEVLGYSRDEFYSPDFNFLTLTAPEYHELERHNFNRHLRGEEVPAHEYTLMTKDGRRIDALIETTLIKYEGESAILGIVTDMTDRNRTEEALRRAQKMESLGVLAGGIAHDFNNLLQAMLGQHHLALRKLQAGDPARENIEKAQKAADRAADLTRKLLAYSGRGKYDTRPVDLTEFIRENIRLLEVAIPKSVALSFECTEPRLIIEADVAQLQQIVMNLVINAAEAIGEKNGLIRVKSYSAHFSPAELRNWMHYDDGVAAGRYAVVEVTDNGIGMEPDIVNRIFDPFFTTKFAGRGLGLAAVIGIVRGHHGALHVETRPGHGTTFRVAFPASDASITPRNPGSHTLAAAIGTGKILLIDDEPGVREVFQSVLSEYGVTIITAASGEDGIEVYRKEQSAIRLVVLDLSMPGMGGEEAFRQLKRIDPGATIVLSSGYDEEDATRRFEGTGLAGFIQKPYDWDVIEETLLRFLK